MYDHGNRLCSTIVHKGIIIQGWMKKEKAKAGRAIKAAIEQTFL